MIQQNSYEVSKDLYDIFCNQDINNKDCQADIADIEESLFDESSENENENIAPLFN